MRSIPIYHEYIHNLIISRNILALDSPKSKMEDES